MAAINKLDGTWPETRRDQIRDEYIRNYRFRIPAADGSPTSQLFVEASAFADAMLGLVYIGGRVADATSRATTSDEEDLDAEGAERGVERLPASKASGYVTVRSRVGGGPILAGTELRYTKRNALYVVSVGGTYDDEDRVAVESVLTGVSTNLDPGVELEFTSPPPGFSRFAAVFENADGTGLTGGAAKETNEEYALRIDQAFAEPPQAANESEVILAVTQIRGYGIAAGFCYPAIRGPGTMGVAILMRPSVPGGSRVPNGAQRAIFEAQLKDRFAGDDGIFVCEGLNERIRVSLKVTWRTAASGWVNAAPWPAFYANPVRVDGTVAISASAFRVTTVDTITPPTVGKVFGLYDASTRTFRRKTISAVTEVVANESYDLEFDMSGDGSSDMTFAPATGAALSPWSASLDALVAPILAYSDKQGPGEQKANFSDLGRRERRYPAPDPRRWPNRIETRLTDGIHALDVVSDAAVVEPAVPKTTTVGVPGTIFYVHQVADIAVFPQ